MSFSTPKKQNPNLHPYAIKTTSTAVLSINSSSPSAPSTTHHYIPPSSPAPRQTRGERRYITRHRYSRSLTSDLPRSLPVPPSADKDDDSDDDTLPRRIQRTYSLPQEIELPEDPKRWTPAQVSLYLTSTLNAHDLPTSVVRDITTFVKDKKISGKSFLKLNQADLEEYGINQLWRTTLINASHALKKNVSHGHIWGNKDKDEDLSSNSNLVITNRKRSLSTTSETSTGRVRDMVDTLERSSSSASSSDEETDSRRYKHTSPKRGVHHHHRHLEQQGRLPQRGSVSTLFGNTGPEQNTPEPEVEDKDSTINAHAKRNVNGNEPRLLPFPPTGASTPNHRSHGYAHIRVTPSHTGTAYPLPPSPDHVQQTTTPYIQNNQPLHQHQYLFPSRSQSVNRHTPNSFDYHELGFKSALPISSSPTPPPIRSPNSQRYVVQHNINVPSLSSPSSTTTTPGGVVTTANGGSGKGRLLPYPPIVGEAELFHPRPRIGLGVGGLAGGLEDRLDGGGGGGGGGGEESVYCSALESQTESADSESGSSGGGNEEASIGRSESEIGVENEATVEQDRDGVKDAEKTEEEEPSIQELLNSQPQVPPRTISGVEAWEMDLGETVKRISTSGTGGAGSILDIGGGGNKAGTKLGKREMKEGGKMTISVLDAELFEMPDQVGDFSLHESSTTTTTASTSTFALRQSAIGERESLIAERESSLDIRESSLDIRESSLAIRESSLDIRESSITTRESTFTTLEAGLSTDKSELDQRMINIQQRESNVEKRESEVRQREEKVEERETEVEKRKKEVEEWYQEKVTRSKWSPLPIEFARRLFATFLLPVLGEERTPRFLLPSSSSASTTTTVPGSSETNFSLLQQSTRITPYLISSWSIKRDFILNRVLGRGGGGGYFVLMSIGICVVFLRGFVRRILRVGGVGRR